jgi:hypothetical protein
VFPQSDYAALTALDMRRHIKVVHLKITEKKGPHCNYAASAKNLTPHIKSVHLKIKDFKCLHCDFATSRKSSLVHHMKVVHQKLPKS